MQSFWVSLRIRHNFLIISNKENKFRKNEYFQKLKLYAPVIIWRKYGKKVCDKLAIMNIFPYFCRMIKKLVYIIIVFSLLAACTHKGISERLNEIDSLVITEEYDSAYTILSEIRESSITNPSDRAHYYLLQTQVGYLIDQPLSSDSLLDFAISYYEKYKDDDRLADCYYYKSNREALSENYSQAILYTKKAEELANDPHQQYKIAERITFLNESSGNYTLQLDYARKTLKLALLANNKNWLAYSYSNVGIAFSNLDQYDSARYYISKSIPYINYIGDNNKASFLANIGVLYKKEEPKRAKNFFQKALKYEEKTVIYEHLADIYYMEGKQDEAYKLWKKALTIDDGDYKDNIIHNILAYDIEHGHVEKVCDNVDEIIHIKDSMLHKLKNDTIKDLQLRFDHEVAMRKQEQVTSFWRIGGLVAVVLLLLLAIYTLWKRSRMNDRMHDVQMQISDYMSQIRELEASKEDASETIKELEKKIKTVLEEMTPHLLRGQMFYEQIRDNKIDTLYQWTKKDEKLFVEFYKVMDYRAVHQIMSVKRADKMTTHRLFYLLLKHMGKTDARIQNMFSISDNGMKVLRSRTKKIE